MRPLALTLILLAFNARADEPPQVAAIAGSGGLSIGVNGDGVLSVFRWPGPGAPDQLAAPGDGASGGGRWGIGASERTLWAGDADARVVRAPWTNEDGAIESVIEWPGAGIRAEVTFTVLPNASALICVVDVFGARDVPQILWRSEWASRTHLVPELPQADGLLDELNGFAAVADAPAGRVWHLRPERPGREDTHRARELVARRAPISAWSDAFDDGVWIGAGPGANARIDGAEAALARHGPIASVIEPAVESRGVSYRAAIAIAVASNHRDAAALLDSTAMALIESGERAAPDDVEFYRSHHLQVLSTLRDPDSRRVVRGLSSVPALARDWPRYGAWVALASDRADAEKILTNYLDAVRMSDAPYLPYGSIPESFYVNGEIASPRFIVDDLGPARTLFATARFVGTLPEADRAAWIRRRLNAVRAAGEFLSIWVDPRRGAPLWSSDPEGLADSQTQTAVFDHYAGITAAIRLLGVAGETAPDTWTSRADTLRELCERIVTTRAMGWTPAQAIVTNFDGFDSETLNAIARAIRNALEGAESLPPDDAARLAAQIALLQEDARVQTNPLPPHLLRRAVEWASADRNEPNAYRSALVLFALDPTDSP